MRHFRLLWVILALLGLFLAVLPGALAQSPEDLWTDPVNLSLSGAADQARIAAGADGEFQVFWWDRFDGLTTARFDGEDWGAAASARLDAESMPTIVEDGRGWAHAFWLGAADRDTGAQPLLHSQVSVGGTSWSAPQTVAESAVAFDVSTALEGGLVLAYVRTLHDSAFPAGIYVRRNAGGGASWGAAVGVYKTIYFRLVTADNARVGVAESGGVIHLVWDDPRLNETYYARSSNAGAAWSTPESLGEAEQLPARPRVFALAGGGALRMWEAAGMGGCVLYQQQITGTQVVASTWSAPQRVFESLTGCPQSERSWAQKDSLLWLWGEGTGALTLAAWDNKSGRWSEPKNVSLSFKDAGSGGWVGLTDLHATLLDGVLAVAGSDPTNDDVWVTTTQTDALKFAFAAPSPWTTPARLSEQGQVASWPTVAMDASGNMHVVWSQSPPEDGPGMTLSYARWDAASGRWSRAIVLQQGVSGSEMTRQPSLAADAGGLLHLVWSGGAQGQIVYSRAKVSEAASAGGWATPVQLSAAKSSASWPQISVDAEGHLFVIYAVPLNEGRGIYLVRSEDGGATWSKPSPVFDAAAAGWAMVDHPALLAAPDGTLHAVWVQRPLPDTWPPLSIAYSRSDDRGESWTKPQEVASEGYDWPRLALANGKTQLLYAAVTGGLWHRWAGDAWSVASRLRGWESVTGPFGLAVSGAPEKETLHLVGADAKQDALLYSVWDGVSWSAAESASLGAGALAGLGAAAAALPQGGRLALALLVDADGNGDALPSVFGAARTIPAVSIASLPTRVPTATPVVTAIPTPTATPRPSPTPDLNTAPQSSLPVDPRILGAMLSAVIVLGVVALWGVRRARGRV